MSSFFFNLYYIYLRKFVVLKMKLKVIFLIILVIMHITLLLSFAYIRRRFKTWTMKCPQVILKWQKNN